MRRGLLLPVTVALGALVLAACLPPAATQPTGAPDPSTTTTVSPTTTTVPSTTTTVPPTTTTVPPTTTTTPSGTCADVKGVSELQGNTYHLQKNEWGSTAPFAICTHGGLDFTISNSTINTSTSGAPGAYPSLYKGCHWGYCSTNSGLPLQSGAVAVGGRVTTSVDTTTVSSGAWDDAYDIWWNTASSTTNNSAGGLEMMIWLNHLGPIQPAGGVKQSSIVIDGLDWKVWYGGPGSNGGTVSYVLNSPRNAVTNLDLGGFATDAIARGYMPPTWWLLDVEAGFEPWIGGQGLAVKSFDVTVH